MINKNAQALLEKAYLKDGEKTWEDLCRRVSHAISLAEDTKENQEKYEEIFYQMMVNMDFIPSSPCLMNAGTEQQQLSSCFILDVKDNIESIYGEVKTEMAKIFQKNGGAGFNISALRPANTAVETSKGYSCGPIGFMEEFDMTADIVTRNNHRKGAIKIDMSDFHPDIENFIKCKDDTTKFTHMNISVSLSDKFMLAVKNDEKWNLRFPDFSVCKEIYNNEWNGDIEEWEDKGYPVKIYKTINAKDLYYQIMEHAWKTGEPGVSFLDNMNKNNPNPKLGKTNKSNPCFTGDMRLLTSNGYKTFEELCDKEFDIVNYKGEISKGKIWKSGDKEVIELSFSNKQKIRCTPNHIFMLQNGEECEAKDLINKKIKFFTNKTNENNNLFVKLGFLQGDGNLTRLNSSSHKGLEVNIGEKDEDIYSLFGINKEDGKRSYYINGYNQILEKLNFDSRVLPLREFPYGYFNWGKQDILDFLKGCYSANGCVNGNHRISYKTTCENFALQLMEILSYFNMSPNLTINKPKNIKFKNGEYTCKQSYDVNLNKFKDIITFYENIGFAQKYKMKKLINLIEHKSPIVRKIAKLGVQKVYDFTEPLTHWGVVENFVVHNCAEFVSIPYNSCNLGSINLSNFVENQEINYDKLEKCVFHAVRFLDNMITVNHLPFEKLEDVTKKVRSIGLGTMGLADMLYKLKVPYYGIDAEDFLINIYESIEFSAHTASMELATERGNYYYYKDSIFEKKHLPRRNSNLLSIAPNGSISFLANTSGGIEPNFALVYTRRTNDGTLYNVINPIFEQYLKENNLYSENLIQKIVNNNGSCQNIDEIPNHMKEVFVTAHDIPPKNHLEVLAIIQRYVDLSCSKTINLPHDSTVKDIEKIYLEAWEKGIKGVTVYRDGSRENQTLSVSREEKEEVIENNNESFNFNNELKRGMIIDVDDDVVGLKRKLTTGCGSLHCQAYFDPISGNLLETYFSKGSTGGCQNFMVGLSRTISLLARAGVDIYTIADQLNSCGVCPSYAVRTATKHDTSKGSCCPIAIGNALLEMYWEMQARLCDYDDTFDEYEDNDNIQINTDYSKCPECGENSLIFEGGCNSCKSCGYTKCG